jgi:hypothetical protein
MALMVDGFDVGCVSVAVEKVMSRRICQIMIELTRCVFVTDSADSQSRAIQTSQRILRRVG